MNIMCLSPPKIAVMETFRKRMKEDFTYLNLICRTLSKIKFGYKVNRKVHELRRENLRAKCKKISRLNIGRALFGSQE